MVSAIVPTYNRAKYLKDTLDSLQKQSLPKEQYEIIVVDQNSPDDTRQVAEKAGVIYVNEPNLGLHYARHAGTRIARGEILAFTDDDAICHPDWLSEILRPYSDLSVGCVGGKILPKWEAEPPNWLKQYKEYLSLLGKDESTHQRPEGGS